MASGDAVAGRRHVAKRRPESHVALGDRQDCAERAHVRDNPVEMEASLLAEGGRRIGETGSLPLHLRRC